MTPNTFPYGRQCEAAPAASCGIPRFDVMRFLCRGCGQDLMTAPQKMATAAARAWASCLKKIFEINPILCRKCGIEMKPVAAIVADAQLVRLLSHLGLSTEFPKARPARSPPLPFSEESQVDPAVDAAEGIDEDRGRHAA